MKALGRQQRVSKLFIIWHLNCERPKSWSELMLNQENYPLREQESDLRPESDLRVILI